MVSTHLDTKPYKDICYYCLSKHLSSKLETYDAFSQHDGTEEMSKHWIDEEKGFTIFSNLNSLICYHISLTSD